MRVSRLLAAPLLVAASAHATPPPGTDLSSPEHAWWECHHDPTDGKLCCSVSDGHVLKDDDWKIGPDGHYKIRVETRWFDVPPENVIQSSTLCGPEPSEENRSMAKVWYSPTVNENNSIESIKVYCFMSGQMY